MKTSNTDLTLDLLFQNTILRLKTLRLTVSHAYMNRKLDEFGHQHDQHIKDCISQQSRRLEQIHFTCEEVEETSLKDTKIDTTSEETENRKKSSCITKQSFNAWKNHIEDFEAEPVSISNHPILFKKAACTENTADVHVHLSTEMQFEKDVDIILPEISNSNAANNHKASEATVPSIPPDTGRKIGFDNIDWHMDVHYMTEEHQNIDQHYTVKISTPNRVAGNHLSCDSPRCDLLDVDNSKFLPDHIDHHIQRRNYISLVSRVITRSINCLKFLKDVVSDHIPHQYSRELSEPTDTVSMISCNSLQFS